MSGADWREHRRIAMRVLGDVGLGKSAMVTLVETEITDFISELNKCAEPQEPCDFAQLSGPSVSNNISIYLFGHKFDSDDLQKILLDTNTDGIVEKLQFAGISIFLPLLSKIIAKLGLMNSNVIKRIVTESLAFFNRQIENRLRTPIGNIAEPPIDYIDGYLKEKRSREARSIDQTDVEMFDLESLIRNVGLFYGAGSDQFLETN